MSEDLRLPLRLVGHLIGLLLQTGLAIEVAGPEASYAPGRPTSQITVRDVLQALRNGQGQDLTAGDENARLVVLQEFESVERAWNDAAAAHTLEELARRAVTAEKLRVSL
jgi:DNA-binding IscR family transcriptional regulator